MVAPAPNSTSAAPLRNDRRDLAAAIAQDAEFGAGRIIFRQQRDLFEQLGAGGVVEIFRRQPLGLLRQTFDHVAGEAEVCSSKAVRFGQSGGMHIHDDLLNALSGALEFRQIRRRSRRGAVP